MMGWLYPWNTKTKDSLVEYLRDPSRYGEQIELLKTSVVGKNHYYLAKNKSTGYVFIGVDMMDGGTRSEPGWGYKSMDESCEPYAYDCPLSFLALASAPQGHAVEWREKVRAHHAAKKAKPKPTHGMVVEFDEVKYRLLHQIAVRMGWAVERISDGRVFRLKASQLNMSL
jgi:hypothetical protein